MRRRILLLIWFIGILFPSAWLMQFSPALHDVYKKFFSPEWVHWVMHAILYTGLGILVILNLDLQPGRKTLEAIILVTLSAGILQEGFQLLSGVETINLNILLDLGIDFVGALLGYRLFYVYRSYLTTH
jgi:VanZ family protein